MSARFPPAQAFEGATRPDEARVAAWLLGADWDGLSSRIDALSPAEASRVGATLHLAVLGRLVPRTSSADAVLAALGARAGADPAAATLQGRWHLPALPFEIGRLRQRMMELRRSLART